MASELQGPMQAAFAKLQQIKQPRKTKGRIGCRHARYSAEYKAAIVETILRKGEPWQVQQIARQNGIPPGTVYNWLDKHLAGIVLSPSQGWEPENGDMYINPHPRKSGSTIKKEREMQEFGPSEVLVGSYSTVPTPEELPKVNEIYGAGGGGCIGGIGVTSGIGGNGTACNWQDQPAAIPEAVMKQREAQREQENNWVKIHRLEHENEVLRRIVRDLLDLNNMY